MKYYRKNYPRRNRYQFHETVTRPGQRYLMASSDKDPGALLIDITPINLAEECCPLCGHKRHEDQYVEG